jgi:hypothetical protein
MTRPPSKPTGAANKLRIKIPLLLSVEGEGLISVIGGLIVCLVGLGVWALLVTGIRLG